MGGGGGSGEWEVRGEGHRPSPRHAPRAQQVHQCQRLQAGAECVGVQGTERRQLGEATHDGAAAQRGSLNQRRRRIRRMRRVRRRRRRIVVGGAAPQQRGPRWPVGGGAAAEPGGDRPDQPGDEPGDWSGHPPAEETDRAEPPQERGRAERRCPPGVCGPVGPA